MYIGAYTDDIILAGRTEEQLQEITKSLSKKYDMKDLRSSNTFLE